MAQSPAGLRVSVFVDVHIDRAKDQRQQDPIVIDVAPSCLFHHPVHADHDGEHGNYLLPVQLTVHLMPLTGLWEALNPSLLQRDL